MKIHYSRALAAVTIIFLNCWVGVYHLAARTPADAANQGTNTDLLINVKVQFRVIEPDPNSPKPAPPGASTNLIATAMSWEGDFEEFLKKRGQRLGAEVMASSNYVTGTTRHQFRVTVADDRQIIIAPFKGGAGVSPLIAGRLTNNFSFHPVFEVYTKIPTSDRTSTVIEMTERCADFIGEKSADKSVRQTAWEDFIRPGQELGGTGMANIYEVTDGQSTIMGFLPERIEIKTTRKVVGLANVPMIGRWFTRTTTRPVWRDVVMVFTVTMVHADGTPYRTQAERDALPEREPDAKRVFPQATTIGRISGGVTLSSSD